MRIGDILRSKGDDVILIGPDASVSDLVSLLKEHNLGAVVVSVGGRTLTGIVSERDVIRRLADGARLLDQRVSEIMTTEVLSCSASDSVESVMATMTERRIRHLPVLDEATELMGIVSIGDLVKSQISELQFERDRLTEYVSG